VDFSNRRDIVFLGSGIIESRIPFVWPDVSLLQPRDWFDHFILHSYCMLPNALELNFINVITSELIEYCESCNKVLILKKPVKMSIIERFKRLSLLT